MIVFRYKKDFKIYVYTNDIQEAYKLLKQGKKFTIKGKDLHKIKKEILTRKIDFKELEIDSETKEIKLSIHEHIKLDDEVNL